MSEMSSSYPEAIELQASPPLGEQSAFFRQALLESVSADDPVRRRKGVFFDDFKNVMTRAYDRMKNLHPNLTLDHVQPSGYRSLEVIVELDKMSSHVQVMVDKLGDQRVEEAQSFARDHLRSAMADQTITKGILDAPPFCWQGQDWKQGEKACTNACFRMMFAGITGWVPNERIIAGVLREKYYETVVPDEVYFRIFYTPTFRQSCDRRIRITEIMGADLQQIETLGGMYREKIPQSKIYCMVNLASEHASAGVWHSSMLLGAQENDVICHDPSFSNNQAFKAVDKNEFVDRWAAAYNRAQIIAVV